MSTPTTPTTPTVPTSCGRSAGQGEDVDLRRITCSGNWEWFSAGYEAGIREGIEMGRVQLAVDLMPAGAELAALRLWESVPHAELERRRTTGRAPAQSWADMHAQTIASWAAVEAAITASQQRQDGSAAQGGAA